MSNSKSQKQQQQQPKQKVIHALSELEMPIGIAYDDGVENEVPAMERTSSVRDDILFRRNWNSIDVYTVYAVKYRGVYANKAMQGVLLPGQVVPHRELLDRSGEGINRKTYPVVCSIAMTAWTAVTYGGYVMCRDVPADRQTFDPEVILNGTPEEVALMISQTGDYLMGPGGKYEFYMCEDFPIGMPLMTSQKEYGGCRRIPMRAESWIRWAADAHVLTEMGHPYPEIRLVEFVPDAEGSTDKDAVQMWNPVAGKEQYVKPLKIPVGFEYLETVAFNGRSHYATPASLDCVENGINAYLHSLGHPKRIGLAWFDRAVPYTEAPGMNRELIKQLHTEYPIKPAYRAPFPRDNRDLVLRLGMNTVDKFINGSYQPDM